MEKLETKRFEAPDDSATHEFGRVDVLILDDVVLKRGVLEPGFSWTRWAGTSHCEIPHTALIVSGCLRVQMKDGTEAEFRAGDVAVIPPGHDMWVIGDEPFVSIDICSVDRYYAHEHPFPRAARKS
jgi:quercetin dioxygenase-like cupin family protein